MKAGSVWYGGAREIHGATWKKAFFVFKIGFKIYLRIIKKNNSADLEIGFLTKSIQKPYWRKFTAFTVWGVKPIIIGSTLVF